MSIVSMVNQATKLQSADSALIEKAGWALRQRLRKQMNQLSGCFFDEVDDFIFGAGKQGQLAGGSDYLGAMREIRAKQVLFEETFLDAVSSSLEQRHEHFDSLALRSKQAESQVIFESMETGLAMDAMARKAGKYYLPYVKQIESLNCAIEPKKRSQLVNGNTLVASVLSGLVAAQGKINVDLEIRLVFMKLFEQHFLMKMEKLFLDIISIVNNIDSSQFVERLHSSSSSFHMPVASSCTAQRNTKLSAATSFESPRPESSAVESSVAEIVQSVRLSGDVPGFVIQMIEEQWRMVLLLIGLNKGVSSLAWQEAEHVLHILVACTAGKAQVTPFDESLLLDKISQGLRLLRMSATDAEQFVSSLKEYLSARLSGAKPDSNDVEVEFIIPIESEATLSPSGESILNADDLNEIAQLISGELVNDDYAQNEEQAQLMDCLSSVDLMHSGCAVQMWIKGRPHDYVVTRSESGNNVFVVTNSMHGTTDRRIALTRSRLGLAISICRGEIRLSRSAKDSLASNVTFFESKA